MALFLGARSTRRESIRGSVESISAHGLVKNESAVCDWYWLVIISWPDNYAVITGVSRKNERKVIITYRNTGNFKLVWLNRQRVFTSRTLERKIWSSRQSTNKAFRSSAFREKIPISPGDVMIYDRDLYEKYRVLWAILRSVCVFAVIIVIIGSNRTVCGVEAATGLWEKFSATATRQLFCSEMEAYSQWCAFRANNNFSEYRYQLLDIIDKNYVSQKKIYIKSLFIYIYIYIRIISTFNIKKCTLTIRGKNPCVIKNSRSELRVVICYRAQEYDSENWNSGWFTKLSSSPSLPLSPCLLQRSRKWKCPGTTRSGLLIKNSAMTNRVLRRGGIFRGNFSW